MESESWVECCLNILLEVDQIRAPTINMLVVGVWRWKRRILRQFPETKETANQQINNKERKKVNGADWWPQEGHVRPSPGSTSSRSSISIPDVSKSRRRRRLTSANSSRPETLLRRMKVDIRKQGNWREFQVQDNCRASWGFFKVGPHRGSLYCRKLDRGRGERGPPLNIYGGNLQLGSGWNRLGEEIGKSLILMSGISIWLRMVSSCWMFRNLEQICRDGAAVSASQLRFHRLPCAPTNAG